MTNLSEFATLSYLFISLFQECNIRFQKKIKILSFLSARELLSELSHNQAHKILKEIKTLDSKNKIIDITDWTTTKLPPPRDIILYGFGRIGRCIARILLSNGNYPLRLKYIVVRPGKDLNKRINLFLNDSVHGSINGYHKLVNNCLEFNFHKITFLEADSPENVVYPTELKNPIVIDNTGKWRNKQQLSSHIKTNEKVILTCPGNDIPNIVFGCNHHNYLSEKIVSAASCTTNAIALILKSLEKNIISGHIETIHSYTNDQNLIDNYHKKPRRDRAAALNLVPTTTGAGKAAGKCIPILEGKLSSSALRIPIADVSLAIIHLELNFNTSKEEIHNLLFQSKFVGSTDDKPVVSSDLLGNLFPCVIDTAKTIVNKNKVIIYSWYDNEMGYSWQVVRLAEALN